MVIPVDLANPFDVELVVAQVQRFVKKLIPVRFGLVPTLHSAASKEQARVANYLHDTYGLVTLLSYLEKVIYPCISMLSCASNHC